MDSLGWSPDSDVIGLTQQLLEEAEDDDASGHTANHQWQDWSVVLPMNVPHQTDSHSCGVAVCGIFDLATIFRLSRMTS